MVALLVLETTMDLLTLEDPLRLLVRSLTG